MIRRLVIIILLALLYIPVNAEPPQEDGATFIAKFIKDNPDRASMYMIRNDSTLINYHANRMMPVGNTAAIIVAIEYAKQAADGKIDPKKLIDTAETNRYYLPNTGDYGHDSWLEAIQKNGIISDGKIPLIEIVKGMLRYDSRANMEFMMNTLGIKNINKEIKELGLTQHQPLYPFNSALCIFEDKTPDEIKKMPFSDYLKRAYVYNKKLKKHSYQIKRKLQPLKGGPLKIWSERLPKSTTKEYVTILKKINSRTYFSAKTQHYLDQAIDNLMSNPKNEEWLIHGGMKGSSTSIALNITLYATTKEGVKTEFAFFLNDLKGMELPLIQQYISQFEFALLRKPVERNNIVAMLAQEQK